jgi:membrane protease YdiL (CAAX protease family)
MVWAAAVYWLRRAVDVEERRWAKRILALAAIDTLVVVGAWFIAHEQPSALGGPIAVRATQERVVIGVRSDRSFGGPGVRIEEVLPGGPAAAAGLEVGDVIVRVAGTEISGVEALRTVIGEQRAGAPVLVELTRGSSASTVRVTPVWSSQLPGPAPGPDAVGRLRACFPRVDAPIIVPFAFILVAIAATAVLVARRSAVGGYAAGVWWTGIALVTAGVASYAASGGACALLGGPTAGSGVVALWISALALAGTALVGRRFTGSGNAPAPTRTWGSAVALGSWYLVTGGLRLAVLVGALIQVLPGREGGGFNPVEALGGEVASTSAASLLLFAIPVIVIGPVGEELVFRGLFQPALGGWLKPAAAIAVTSVLFASLHWTYGAKLPMVMFVAAVLGWARIASCGLRAPIALHMLVNAVGLLPIAVRALWPG